MDIEVIYPIWLSLLFFLGIATKISKKFNRIPIIQLLSILIVLPILKSELFPILNITKSEFLEQPFIESFYILNFSLLLAYILSDMIDFKYEKELFKIILYLFL